MRYTVRLNSRWLWETNERSLNFILWKVVKAPNWEVLTRLPVPRAQFFKWSPNGDQLVTFHQYYETKENPNPGNKLKQTPKFKTLKAQMLSSGRYRTAKKWAVLCTRGVYLDGSPIGRQIQILFFEKLANNWLPTLEQNQPKWHTSKRLRAWPGLPSHPVDLHTRFRFENFTWWFVWMIRIYSWSLQSRKWHHQANNTRFDVYILIRI